MITPTNESFGKKRRAAMERDLTAFELQIKRNKFFDSGMSLGQERKALLYALL